MTDKQSDTPTQNTDGQMIDPRDEQIAREYNILHAAELAEEQDYNANVLAALARARKEGAEEQRKEERHDEWRDYWIKEGEKRGVEEMREKIRKYLYGVSRSIRGQSKAKDDLLDDIIRALSAK